MNDLAPWVIFIFSGGKCLVQKIFSDTTIGRGGLFSKPAIKVQLPFLKGIHGRIVGNDGGWFYEDLSGTPTTIVNGTPLVANHGVAISENTVITIAETPGQTDALTIVLTQELEREHIPWHPSATPHQGLGAPSFGKIIDAGNEYQLLIGGQIWSQQKFTAAPDDIKQQITQQTKHDSEVLKISLRDVQVGAGFRKRTLLKDVNLEVNPTDMVLVLGSSGAGKSTFLNAVSGFEPANAEVVFKGLNFYEHPDRLRQIARHVPQYDHLRSGDSVKDTLNDAILLNPGTSHLSRPERKTQISEVLALFGLENEAKNQVSKLSGGQRKRLSIAVEYIANPMIFFLDEPDSGLDAKHSRDLMKNLRSIANQGKIVMVISHNADQVTEYFNKVLVLGRDSQQNCGTTVFYGAREDAFAFFNVSTFTEIIEALDSTTASGDSGADYFISKYKTGI